MAATTTTAPSYQQQQQQQRETNPQPHPSLSAYFVELPAPPPSASSVFFDFHPTRYTIGGPISALLLHCMGRAAKASFASSGRGGAAPAPELTPARLTVNLHRPVPAVRPIRVTVTTVQSSRSIRQLAASVTTRPDDDGTASSKPAAAAAATAEALFQVPQVDPALAAVAAAGAAADRAGLHAPPSWMPSAGELDVLHATRPDTTFRPPGQADAAAAGTPPSVRFFDSIATVFNTVDGGRAGWVTVPASAPFLDAIMWLRVRDGSVALVEPLSGSRVPVTAQELLVIAGDAGNGISPVVPFGAFAFSNVSVNYFWLRNPPETGGDDTDGARNPWLMIKARTRYQDNGAALTFSTIFDGSGAPCAYVMQNLVVRVVATGGKNNVKKAAAKI
ncbi:thioesterase-like superfamily-domain-containing protein [Zopfochytrium polystomum]|nr:thioesterase-like superfamily-domain-containing protein [Zopfochytrium polystomum]